MKKWNLQVKNSPKEITEKLESSLGQASQFVLDMNSKSDFVVFKLRKRILVAIDSITYSRIIVNGRILKPNKSKDETKLEITFSRAPWQKFLWLAHIILLLGFIVGIFLKFDIDPYVIIFGGILLTIGVLLLLQRKKEFDKDVQAYKKMISKMLEV